MGRKYNFSRQYILQLLKFYGIPRRSRQAARLEAIDQGKLFSNRLNELGEKEKVFHINRFVNEDFFKSLGLRLWPTFWEFFTQKCISPSKFREERKTHKNKSLVCSISVSQKEPELLEKLLALMESNAHHGIRNQKGE